MMKQKKEDNYTMVALDDSMSPNARRKNESTLKQLQNDVLGKARSTLSSLGDVWKGKNPPAGSPSSTTSNYGDSPPRSPKNFTQTANKGLDFFNWSKSKKNSDVVALAKSQKKDKGRNEESNGSKSKPKDNIRRSAVSYADLPYDYENNNMDYIDEKSEELSHSMEDGIHYLVTDERQYNENNSYFDGRPKSYNEKFSYLYDYDFQKEREQFNELKPSIQRRSQDSQNQKAAPSQKHILFNDEDDVRHFIKNKPSNKPVPGPKPIDLINKEKSGTSCSKNPQPSAKDIRKQEPEILSPPVRKGSKEDKTGQNVNMEQNVIRATLRLQKLNEEQQKQQSTPPRSPQTYSTKHIPTTMSGRVPNSPDVRQTSLNYPAVLSSVANGDVSYRLWQTGKMYLTGCELPERNMSPTIFEEQEEYYHNQQENVDRDKKTVKKICFKEPENDSMKCETLPRSSNRKSVNQKKYTDDSVNEYLDSDMRSPRRGSLDSDLESQAMRIVRTVGQAFEVCHKLSVQNNSLDNADDQSETQCDLSEQDRLSDHISDDDEPKKEPIPITPEPQIIRPNHLDLSPSILQSSNKKSPLLGPNDNDKSPSSPLSASREIHQLREQLEQQQMQTRQALAQLMLVREQLLTETNARMEAQARTQQLLQQNRELLEHIASLGGYHEPDRPGYTSASIGLAPQLSLFLQDPSDLRKTFSTQQTPPTPSANNLFNLGTLNHQLTSLQKQLGSLNQQQQNLQNYQNNNIGYDIMGNIHSMQAAQPKMVPNSAPPLSQQELYQLNQDLLSRLQNLSFGTYPNNLLYANQTAQYGTGSTNSPSSSSLMNSPNNNSANITSPNNNTNIPQLSLKNRNSYASSMLTPDEMSGMSLDKSMDSIQSDDRTSRSHFIRPISQVGTMTTVDADGKVKVIVPIQADQKSQSNQDIISTTSSASALDTPLTMRRNENRKITLKVTDESGIVTNSKKLPATPSFITRSTSEKVPNRSQIMSQVQRTQWARHTTK